MANKNLKGITYTVGGDTTGLQNALKGVNSSAKDLNSELNSVNRLLKLDPSNMVLLTQKQDLLNKSISDTKDKLSILKNAQAQVDEQFKNGDSLVATFNAVPAWWNGLWTNVGQFFTNCWNGITNFFTVTIPSLVQGFIGIWNNLPYYIGYALGTMIADIINFGVSAFNWVTNDLPKIINGIINWFAQLPGKVWTWLLNTFTKIHQWGTNSWNYLSQQIPKIINDIGTWFGELPGKVWTWLSNTVDKVKTWCSNLISTAETEIPKFVLTVVNFIGELPGKMLDIGKNIVTGIWNGINGAVGWLHDKITSFCNGIVDGIKSALKIHSPSQVLADEVGQYMALGIGQGFTDSMASVSKQMQAAIPTNFDLSIGTAINGMNGLKSSSSNSSTIENTASYSSPVNLNVKMGDINVNGNADQNTIAQMKQMVQDQVNDLNRQIYQAFSELPSYVLQRSFAR